MQHMSESKTRACINDTSSEVCWGETQGMEGSRSLCMGCKGRKQLVDVRMVGARNQNQGGTA